MLRACPRFIGYHIRHWADGGETSLDNLVTLCRHHHRQLHRGSFTIAVEQSTAGPQLLFTTPSGSRIESSFFPLFQNVSAERSQEALRAMAPDVDAHTCVSKWRGEDCDYGMAIDALLERDDVPRRPPEFP